MTTENTLLVILDPDDDDMTVVARATELASRFDARIELFSCVYDVYIAGERLLDSPDLNAAKAKRVQEQLDLLEDLARPLRDEGYDVRTDAVWDRPVYEGIVRKVVSSRPRMVLRNNQYHSAIQRAVFSNDDWNLIRTCPAPLLITRPRKQQHKKLQVWAAVDPFHEHDRPAELDNIILAAAQALALATHGKLNVVHTYDTAAAIATASVGPASPVVMAPVDDIIEQVRENHLRRLMELTDDYDVPFDRVHNVPGRSRSEIPRLLLEREADVLVIGAISRGLLKRALIGNTAEKLLDRVPCDLLIVKPAGFETPVQL